jgi:hypothetical protein
MPYDQPPRPPGAEFDVNATVAITVPTPTLHALGTVQQLADNFAVQAKAANTIRA